MNAVASRDGRSPRGGERFTVPKKTLWVDGAETAGRPMKTRETHE